MTRPSLQDNKNLTIINFFGGPGATKSTTASGLFHEMKKRHDKVELISEWIKGEGVWERRHLLFGEQDYIFAHQHRSQRRLVGHDIEYAITDSPLLLGLFYLPPDFPSSFTQFARDISDTYNNINIFIDRNPDLPYVQEGRNEDLASAIQIDTNIRKYFDDHNIDKYHIQAGDDAVRQALLVVTHHRSRFNK